MSKGDPSALRALLPKLAGGKVGVAGDPVLDCYLNGSTHRISREAPVLIVKEESREHRLGGAANTAHNLAALGGQAHLIGLIGDDQEGETLTAQVRAAGIVPTLVRRRTGCTVTKTRVMGGGLHTTKQQMLRIDRENDGQLEPEDAQALLEAAKKALPQLDTLVISDYGDGALTPTYVELARLAKELGKRVIVDSRHALNQYRGVFAVTPNEPEAEAVLGRPLRTQTRARAAAEELLSSLELSCALLTRGREGMVIAQRDHTAVIPAFGGHEAVDVTGAGDTVVAAFALAITAGASVVQAAALANCAASIVVRFVGAATCSTHDLEETLREGGAS